MTDEVQTPQAPPVRVILNADHLAAAANLLVGAQVGQLVVLGVPIDKIINSLLMVVARLVAAIESPVAQTQVIEQLMVNLRAYIEDQVNVVRVTKGGIMIPRGAPIPPMNNGKTEE